MPRRPTPQVALLSAASAAHLDTDLPLLAGALADRGVVAEVVDWHDSAYRWHDVALAVIRSPWDYTDDHAAFLAALERVAAATTLLNPLPVVEATIDKRYLLRLASAGVPVVPTTVIAPGEEVVLPDHGPCVVKPTVSAGARDTERYGAGDGASAAEHVARLQANGRSALVQPYVDGVDDHGETGLVFLGDEFSHGFRKGPILRPGGGMVEGLYREEEITGRQPSTAERELAEQVLDALGAAAPGWSRKDLLYARVDLVPGPGGPLLMELELIEPSLFLEVAPASAAAAAAVIADRLGR